MSIGTLPGQVEQSLASSIDQVFQARGLWRWYADKVTNAFDGVSEKGEDFSTRFGTPVGVPIGGVVKRIVHNNNAINDVVEIMDQGGAVWLYQHITATVRVNQVLQCGDVVGTENGMPPDKYSTGPHIEVRYCPPGAWRSNIDSWVEPWVNPRAIFAALGSQQAGTTGPFLPGQPLGSLGSPGGNGGGVPGLLNLPKLSLQPNADVKALLQTLDRSLDIVNPFDVQGAQQDQILGATFTDPFSWIEGFGENLLTDTRGLILRLLLILLGVFIIKRVTSDFIDFDALSDNLQALPQMAARFLQ